MASVDDNEELIATRRLNGLDDGLYESDKNVANKIKRQVENTINYYKNIDNIEEIPIDILRAMYQDILEERKQDKKRIKELEEDLITAYMKGYADAEEKYREKIKEKRDEINKKYEDSKDENGESPYYYPEYTIKVLEKLLEEK